MKLLITRPYSDSIRTKKLIEEKTDHRVSISPAIKIKYLRRKLDLKGDEKIIITSANGIEALAKNTNERNFSIYLIGESSLLRAKELGFKNLNFNQENLDNSNSDNLSKYIISNSKNGDKFLHVTSKNAGSEIKNKLTKNSREYKGLFLYHSEPAKLSLRVQEKLRLNSYDGFIFFSALTAKYFLQSLKAQKLEKSLRNRKIFCLSPSISDVFKDYGDLEIVYPDKININSFVGILGEYNDCKET